MLKTFEYDSLVYTYGHNRQRIAMEERVGGALRTKRYVGSCEYVTETEGGNTLTRSLTYLTGPFGVFAVVEKCNGEEILHYILKDNLGSWTTVTDSEGNVEQRLSYDAWGNLRNPDTWSGSFTGKPMFDKGFTGHEHLTAFGLINMKFTLSERSAKLCLSTAERCELGGANGRMYDPVMSSFLSVDRYVQHPESAQGFNRYAYCMYNPLRYVDPTGFYITPGDSHHPDNPPYEIIDGQVVFLLPEVTITPYDEPTVTVNESYYPNTTSGGGPLFDWSTLINNDANGPSIGQGGGGDLGEGSNHNNSDSQGFLPEMAPIISYEGIIIGYKQKQWQNPANRAQKTLNQKKAYEIQKILKNQGVSKHVKDIKAGKISNLDIANKGIAAIGIGLEIYDVINNKEIMASNIINSTITLFSVGFWPISGIYLATDIGVLLFTGQSIGEHIDNWVGGPVVDFNKP